MNEDQFPTAYEVLSGKRRLPMTGNKAKVTGLLDSLMEYASNRVSHRLDVELLQLLYEDPQFAVRSGFLPDVTRVKLVSGDRPYPYMELSVTGRERAAVTWDHAIRRNKGWVYSCRIGDSPTWIGELDIVALQRELDRPIKKPPAAYGKKSAKAWTRDLEMSRNDVAVMLSLSGAGIAGFAASGSLFVMAVGIAAGPTGLLLNRMLRGKTITSAPVAVGLDDPESLYQLMSSNPVTASTFSDLADRSRAVSKTLSGSIEPQDVDMLTRVEKSIPRLVNSCLATLETVLDESDRHQILADTASAIGDVVTMAEGRVTERQSEAIAEHRHIMAAVRRHVPPSDQSTLLH